MSLIKQRLMRHGASAVVAAAIAAASMVPAQARTLSFASANPPADTGFNRALQWWADQIKERTDGALDVKI